MRSTVEPLRGSGRGLDRRRRERRRAAVAHQHAADAGALADAQQRAEVARILDVLGEDDETLVAARGSGPAFASELTLAACASSAAKPLCTAPPSQIGSDGAALVDSARRPRVQSFSTSRRRPPWRAARIQTRRTSGARCSSASCTGWNPKMRVVAAIAGAPTSSSTTANAAMPSPRPIAPSPSFVVALRPTAFSSVPRTRAMRSMIRSRCGASFGASATSVRSQLTTR